MDIIVLAGGLSTERDVSFKTGSMVASALRENGHRVILLDVFMGYSDKEENLDEIFERSEEISVKTEDIPETAPDLAAVKASRKDQSPCFFGPNVIRMCQMADIVFMALHGENGENGKIQAAFDLFGIRYTGSDYLSSAIAMDKGMAKQVLMQAKVPVPAGMSMKKENREDDVTKLPVSLPCVVKPCCGGSSVGVTICHTEDDVIRGEKLAFSLEKSLVMEEFVTGDEFTCAVIDGKPYPVVSITPKSGYYDFSNKYKAGATEELCPAPISAELTAEIQNLAVKAYNAIGLEAYARMDFLVRKEDGKVFCLEANTLPGMTPTSLVPKEAAAVGIDYAHLCQLMIDVSMKKYA